MTPITSATSVKSNHYLYSLNRLGLLSVAWLVCGVAIVALLPPQLTLGLPLWKVQLSRIVLANLLAAPLLAAVLADRQRDSSGDVRWLAAFAIVGASYIPTLLYLILAPGFSVPILLISIAAGSIVVLVPLLVGHRHIGKSAGIAGIVAAALIGVGVGVENTANWTITATAGRLKGPETKVRAVPTALHTLRVTSYRGFIDAKVAGGGIASLGKGYLAASGEGALFYIERDPTAGGLTATRLNVSVPINHTEFFAETSQTGTSLAENNQVAMASTWFRVTDLLVEEKDGLMTLFAVHNYWKSAEKCTVLRISVLSAPTQEVVSNHRLASTWRTVYDAAPCQALTAEGQGGRLVRLPGGELLVTVGAHAESNSPNAQNPDSDYGKTVLINVDTKKSQVFTLGHRNPQGLATSHNGDVWQTEHGPRGGDELNRLVRGANYGWPVVSYGVPYFGVPPPFNGVSGSHEGFEPPTYSWVPSIGVSNLVEITGDLFPYWRHDMMIASLVRTTLWRTRIVDRRVTYVEEIKLDERIRDIIEDPAGRLVLWTDNHSLVFVEPLTSTPGGGGSDDSLMAAVAIAKCLACHVTLDKTTHGIGPNLRGVIGRPVASAKGYAYSDALRKAGGVWNEERLDKFLTNPQEFAPGTKVEMQAVPDAVERRQVIQYLQSVQ